MTAGEPLRRFLLEKPLVYELRKGERSLEGKWINKFLGQLAEVREKLRRIHFKSLGGILSLQEKIGQQFKIREDEAIPVVVPVAKPAP
jgi:hypothetical protein